MNIHEFDVTIMNINDCVVSGWGILHPLPMNIVKSFACKIEQSNTHLNLAYQLLQAQHLLKSAHERYLSLILPTSLSLSLEPARNTSLYITQTST